MRNFAADRMLGKLAKWLRALGYDVVYMQRAGNNEILSRLREGRILLTRDSRADLWQKQGKVFVVNANDPREQLREVVQGLGLTRLDHTIFGRCLKCNSPVNSVSRDQVWDEVPEYIWQTHQQFHRCESCGKVYWSGSHSERMRQRLEEIFADCE